MSVQQLGSVSPITLRLGQRGSLFGGVAQALPIVDVPQVLVAASKQHAVTKPAATPSGAGHNIEPHCTLPPPEVPAALVPAVLLRPEAPEPLRPALPPLPAPV